MSIEDAMEKAIEQLTALFHARAFMIAVHVSDSDYTIGWYSSANVGFEEGTAELRKTITAELAAIESASPRQHDRSGHIIGGKAIPDSGIKH